MSQSAPDFPKPHDPGLPADGLQPEDAKDLHIPGAGTFGMAVLIMSLSMLFIASMTAYVFIRSHTANWGRAMPHVPQSLWLSTAVILLASVTIQRAHRAVRRDDERGLRRGLSATFGVGIAFLLLQALNWGEFYLAIRRIDLSGAYLGMFFVLTGLHAAHVIGGLIPLGIVRYRAGRGRYSRNYHPGVRYLAIYWHFLDAVWVVLFGVLYF